MQPATRTVPSTPDCTNSTANNVFENFLKCNKCNSLAGHTRRPCLSKQPNVYLANLRHRCHRRPIERAHPASAQPSSHMRCARSCAQLSNAQLHAWLHQTHIEIGHPEWVHALAAGLIIPTAQSTSPLTMQRPMNPNEKPPVDTQSKRSVALLFRPNMRLTTATMASSIPRLAHSTR